MKYRVTNIRPLMRKLRRNGLFAVDSEVNPDVVYVIDRGEIGIVNRSRWGYVYRLTVEEARAGAAEMDNRFAREEVKEIADLAEWKKERKREECCSCVNYERCGEPASKPSKGACKAMWESYFKGADTPEKLAFRMCESNDCTECPATGMCGELMWEWECENIVRAWLKSENVLYTMAMERS